MHVCVCVCVCVCVRARVYMSVQVYIYTLLKGQHQEDKGHEKNARVQENIKLNGDEIEEVDDFTYLGSKMSNTGDGEVEIRARLAKASQAFASLSQGTFA